MIRLERTYLPFGAYGVMTFPGFSCLTVERPWFENRPFVSCIPEGIYEMRRTMYRGAVPTWEVVDVPDRTEIKVHPANWPKQLQGCIALGREFFTTDRGLGVSASRATLDAFLRAVDRSYPSGSPTIRIASGQPWGVFRA